LRSRAGCGTRWQDPARLRLNPPQIDRLPGRPRWQTGAVEDRGKQGDASAPSLDGVDAARAKARTPAPTSRTSYIFATRIGRPINQRNVLRALYRAQERARTPEGLPTFQELFEVDARGHLVVDADGEFVPRNVRRRELRLPDFHALRHGAAMDCDDAEEARDLLRHKNSNVTRAIYRAHFGDRRREQLRARMERRMERSADTEAQDDQDQDTQPRGIEGAGQ
jgi:integrase